MSALFIKIWVSLLVSCVIGFCTAWGIRAFISRVSNRRLEALYKESMDIENKKIATLNEDITNLKLFYQEQIDLMRAQQGLSPAGIDISTEQAPETGSPQEAPDDLTKILGITSELQNRLNNLGIYSYKQLSQLTPRNINWVANRVGLPPEKIYKQRWVQQASDMFDHIVH